MDQVTLWIRFFLAIHCLHWSASSQIPLAFSLMNWLQIAQPSLRSLLRVRFPPQINKLLILFCSSLPFSEFIQFCLDFWFCIVRLLDLARTMEWTLASFLESIAEFVSASDYVDFPGWLRCILLLKCFRMSGEGRNFQVFDRNLCKTRRKRRLFFFNLYKIMKSSRWYLCRFIIFFSPVRAIRHSFSWCSGRTKIHSALLSSFWF